MTSLVLTRKEKAQNIFWACLQNVFSKSRVNMSSKVSGSWIFWTAWFDSRFNNDWLMTLDDYGHVQQIVFSKLRVNMSRKSILKARSSKMIFDLMTTCHPVHMMSDLNHDWYVSQT